MTFRIRVADSGSDPVQGDLLLERTLTTPHRWESVPIDLAEYAGKQVAISLSIEAESPGTLGLWGSPVVRDRGRMPSAARPEPSFKLVADDSAGPPQGVILILADTLRKDHLDLYGYGSIRALDVEIARLQERLRSLGLTEKTLLVFTSDHGEEFHDHGRMFHGQSVYGELTGNGRPFRKRRQLNTSEVRLRETPSLSLLFSMAGSLFTIPRELTVCLNSSFTTMSRTRSTSTIWPHRTRKSSKDLKLSWMTGARRPWRRSFRKRTPPRV